VGVYEGQNAADLLLHAAPRRLYLVDCWRHQPQDVYPDSANAPNTVQRERYDIVRKKFRGDLRVEIFREDSLSAARRIWDAPIALDWAYIDGNHSAEAVAADLRAWASVVKVHGWLMGHDYAQATPGVMAAVDDFALNTLPGRRSEFGNWRWWGMTTHEDWASWALRRVA
jgi:hypothetical protein